MYDSFGRGSSEKTYRFVGVTTADAVMAAQLSLGCEVEVINERTVIELLAAPASDESIEKCFFGDSPAQAINLVKAEFGGDAIFLDQREVLEIEVKPEPEVKPVALCANHLLNKTYGGGQTKHVSEPAPPSMPSASEELINQVSGAGVSNDVLMDIQSRLDDLCRLAKQGDRPMVPEALNDLYFSMLDNQVSDELARHLVESLCDKLPAETLRNRGAVRDAMLEAVARMIPVDGGIKLRKAGGPTVIAVVGATGVGKTTSIAKLAVQLKLHRGCRVGLVTEDTSRPGGTEQLRAVSQLLSIPLIVADTVDRIRQSVLRLSDRDVILIDTAGRVPTQESGLNELADFVEQIVPDEVHLAISSVSASKNALKLVENFSRVKFDHIIFTKLDEACDYGLILNVAAHIDRGVSYITTGQDYMENIEQGDPQRLASLILGESLLSGGVVQ